MWETDMTPRSEESPRLGVMGQPSRDGDYDPENWAIANFGGAEFGHKRKSDRLVTMGTTAALHGSWTTPLQCRTDAEAKAACRLFNSDVVTHEAVTKPHRERVIGQARVSANPVLFIHDIWMLIRHTMGPAIQPRENRPNAFPASPAARGSTMMGQQPPEVEPHGATISRLKTSSPNGATSR